MTDQNLKKLGKVIVSGVAVGPEIEPHWQALRQRTELHILEKPDSESLLEAISGVEVAIVRGTKVTRKLFERGKDLKGIVLWGVGYDNVDVTAATDHGLPVITLPVFLASMAEAVFYFLFSITKKYDRLHQLLLAGERPRLEDRSHALEAKVLGCIGLGRIGYRVARIGLALDMEVLACDPYLKEAVVDSRQVPLVPLDDLLQQSDFVSLHAPATAETHHMIDADALTMMKPTAYLINIARGALVDETALYQALVKGDIAGAALDVFEEEPVSPNHPLLSLDNVWATPHYLGITWKGLAQVAAAAQDATLKLLKGEAPGYHIINPEVYGGER